MGIADLVHRALQGAPIAIEAYDGSSAGPAGAVATVLVRSPDALNRFLFAPNDLGLGRAYVAGDLDVEGDLFGAHARVRPDRSPPRPGAAHRPREGGRTEWAEATPPAAGGGPDARVAALPRSRRRGRLVPLRPVERVLPAHARPVDDVLVRALGGPGGRARGGPVGQARAHLPEAGPARRACGSSTSAAAGARWPCTPPSTMVSRSSASPCRAARSKRPPSG